MQIPSITGSMTAFEIKNEVVLRLGGSTVAVELGDEDLMVCMRDALRRYSRANPLHDRESAEIPSSGIKTMPVHPETYAIMEVEFQDALNVLEGRDSLTFNIFNSWNVIGAGYGSGGFGNTAEYAYLQQWRDLTRRQFSLEPDWFFQEDVQYDEATDLVEQTKKIYFFNPTGLAQRVTYIEVRPRDFREIIPRDHDWVIDWAAAHAKEIVGHVRNKFKQIPTAGQPVSLDGAALLAESQNEKAQLLEELKTRFFGNPPMIWG